MPKITVIPAITAPTIEEVTFKKKRVAAYARVSTDSEEQLTSYEAQVDYYTHYIKQNPEWEYVDVYTDEGISATNTKHRDGFNRMITDALSGKIDLIITKSVSRFARNTVDSLTTVRKLKDKGVEVYFQKENIYTLDSKGELLITIMSSLAQEESRSISENTTWGKRKRFQDGQVLIPYGAFLGYRKGADGRPEIVPEEAETVRFIYRQYISGATPHKIAKKLTEMNVLTPGGKKKWSQSTVISILTNEKYKGDALLQKSITVDFLTKKKKVNEGEVPQYYVENSHPAIISPEEFDLVQAEMAKRSKVQYSSTSAFSSKLICEDCGSFFGAKVWHSNDKYRRVIYQCNKKFEHNCETPHLHEQQIIDKFMKAFAEYFSDRENVIKNCRAVLNKLKPADETELQEQLNEIETEFEKIVSGDSSTDFDELNEKYNAVKAELENRKTDNLNKKARFTQIRAILKILESDSPAEFDEKLWTVLIEKATVKRNGQIEFTFKDGRIITE